MIGKTIDKTDVQMYIVVVSTEDFEMLYAGSHYPAASGEACLFIGTDANESLETTKFGDYDVVEVQIAYDYQEYDEVQI